MKRYLSFFACAIIFLSLSLPSLAQAVQPIEVITTEGSSGSAAAVTKEEAIEYIVQEKKNPGFIGQDHYYTVTFRGNGEAVVNGKIIFTNLQDEPIETITLMLPKVTPQDMSVYQVQREKECLRYIPSPLILDSTKTGQSASGSTGVTQIPEDFRIDRCAEYTEPNYYNYYYGKSSYVEAKASVQGDTITITLPKPVMADASGSVMFYYRAPGYTSKTWSGAYKYSFESLKVNELIRTLQIGINTDNDLFLSNTASNVNYARTSAPMMAAMDFSDSRAIESGQFDNYYQQIGYGQVNKTSSNLQPNESYTVSGEYAKNRIQLYAGYVLLAIIILIAFILLTVFGIKALVKKLQAPASSTAEKNKFTTRSILVVIGAGFIVAVLVGLNTLLGVGLFAWLTSGYYYTSYMPVLMIMLMLIMGSVDMLLLVVPAVVIGYRKGIWLGVLQVVATVIWMILFASILLVVVFLVGITQTGQPVPMMMDSGMMRSAPAAPGMQEAPTLQVAPDTMMEWTPATSTQNIEIDLQK